MAFTARGYPDNNFQNAVVNQLAPQRGEPTNELERIARRLEEINQNAAQIRDRLERMVARAFGEGMVGEKNATGPAAAGGVGQIQVLLTSVAEELVKASEVITRLEQLA